MDTIDLPYVLCRLRERRDQLTVALSTEDRGDQPVELDQNRVGRLTRMDAMAQAEMAKATRALLQTELRRVAAAITRVENQSYGTCCRCQEPVGRERLNADPATPFCLACFEDSEAAKTSGPSRR